MNGAGFESSLIRGGQMEKWMVVTGIWMMFATCMVLFIRGATTVSRSELVPVEVRDDERDARKESLQG
jgi:hypothetical protein